MVITHSIISFTLCTPAPLFETECSYVEATIKEFLSWTANDGEPFVGPFSDYHCKEFWAYADYKYIAQLFQDKPAMFQVNVINFLFFKKSNIIGIFQFKYVIIIILTTVMLFLIIICIICN